VQSRRPRAVVVGVDDDGAAVACAARNGVRVIRGDLGSPLASRVAHVVTAIAPYVPTHEMRHLPRDVVTYEPAHALDGGDRDGLDVVRAVVTSAARLLVPGGWLVVELGGDQPDAVAPDLAESGFCEISVWRDDDGDVRGLECRLGVTA
jgi:release factor glutamine methyltransferase